MNQRGKSILVVEDDIQVRTRIKQDLEEAGFQVLEAESYKQAQHHFLRYDPCFVMIEAMIQGKRGFELCNWIRTRQKSEIPIMIVTQLADKEELVRGLRMGADDYVTKPFHSEELIVRVETVLRRTAHRCNKLTYREITVKPLKGEVKYKGEVIQLTLHEFKLLYYLMRHPNQILSRIQILDELYPNDHKIVSERTIDVHILKLREKFKDHLKDQELIETVRGVGYRFIAY